MARTTCASFSTFIPRIVWPTKPIYGRSQWVSAWIAGSEMERDEDFTGPAIGILGATQLNGGAIGTLIVLACVATLLSTAYAYFSLYAAVPWAQFWWAITYYNAWFMVVNDDPAASGFTTTGGFRPFRSSSSMWWAAKWAGRRHARTKVSAHDRNLTSRLEKDSHDFRRLLHEFRTVPSRPSARPGRASG